MTQDIPGGRQLNIDAALLAYLVPVLGPAYILLARRDDDFVRYHAVQSLQLVLALALIPLAWLILSWLLVLVPYGALVAAYLFALVVAAYLAVVIAWLAGIVNALRAKRSPVPFFGRMLR